MDESRPNGTPRKTAGSTPLAGLGARGEAAYEAAALETELNVRLLRRAGRRADQWSAASAAIEVKSLFVRCVFGRRSPRPVEDPVGEPLAADELPGEDGPGDPVSGEDNELPPDAEESRFGGVG